MATNEGMSLERSLTPNLSHGENQKDMQYSPLTRQIRLVDLRMVKKTRQIDDK